LTKENNYVIIIVVYIERRDCLTSMQLIRNELKSQIGKEVYLKADRGRKRFITRKGTIDAVYPSLFVIDVEFENSPSRKMTFTYSDVLTNTVELMIVDEEKSDENTAS
jgi:uncharacterized protein Veg